MVTVQQIIDSGKVTGEVSTAVLETTLGVIEFQIDGLQASSFGAMGLARIQAHKKLQTKINQILDARRGLDGMTELTT